MNYRRALPGTLIALILAGCNTSSTPPSATVALVGPDGKAISFPTPAPIPTPIPAPSNINSYGYVQYSYGYNMPRDRKSVV